MVLNRDCVAEHKFLHLMQLLQGTSKGKKGLGESMNRERGGERKRERERFLSNFIVNGLSP